MGIANYSAFRRGVALGFSSPYRLLLGRRWHPSYSGTESVASAWSAIGKLLNEELHNEGIRQIGNRTVKEGKRSQRLAS